MLLTKSFLRILINRIKTINDFLRQIDVLHLEMLQSKVYGLTTKGYIDNFIGHSNCTKIYLVTHTLTHMPIIIYRYVASVR